MTILFTALALAASAVFFYQITRPISFLSAILGVEYSRLLAPEPGKPRADGGPTWDTVYAEFRDRLKAEKTTPNHLAVMELLDAVVDVERGRRPAAEALAKSQRQFESDPDNFISRLCHARLTDAALADSPAMERFARWREILEQPKPASVAALYNKEFDDAFFDVLSRYIKRLDVRVNLVKYLDHYQVTSHYAALPMIQARLSKLADELSGVGKAAEAETCRRWVVRACLGLMEYEPDAGTGLLCADLAGRCLPAADILQTGLLSLRADYHTRLADSVSDLASFNRVFVSDPPYYLSLLRRFFGTAALAVLGIGSCGLVVAAVLSALVFSSRADSPSTRGSGAWSYLAGLAFLVVLVAASSSRLATNPHSESCVYVRLLSLFGIGLIAPCFFTGLTTGTRKSGLVRHFVPVMTVALFTLVALAPGDDLALWLRPLEVRGGSLPYLLAIIGVGLALSIILRRSQFHMIARRASALFMLCMMLATFCCANVSSIEMSRNLKYARARMDEFWGVLGHDWRIRYSLPHSAAAYDSPTSQTTP